MKMEFKEGLISAETILQDLIRFDTTNPPGNETACIQYIGELLEGAGLKYRVYAKDNTRPNLVCRLEGKGEAPPILIYGHVDVVTTHGQNWTYPPFEGVIVDGFLWGRGALDMKGGVAMMIHTILRMKSEGITPAGDVILLVLSDEENGGKFGAEFMVSEQPEVFEGVKYALGEFGGFNLSIAGKRFYLIQVAEKQVCTIRMRVTGPGGHGASIVPGSAVEKLGEALTQLSIKKLPFHLTDPVKDMIKGMAREFGFPLRGIIKLLMHPLLSGFLLKQLGEVGNAFLPMFHNTVNATMVRGGEKVNVIPSQIDVTIDGRMLPGFHPDDMLAELKGLVTNQDVDFEVSIYEPGPPEADMGLYTYLANVLKKLDPEGIPVPFLLPAVTDGRILSKLGIQSYGFIPMKLPEDFSFFKLAHAADERIPVSAISFGAEGIYQALINYSGSDQEN
jgi:acetylornithine deacetylase/succinyl-diaminopimelate desuccinylase-like protein